MISEEKVDSLLTAIQTLRDEMPLLTGAATVGMPAVLPELAAISLGLTTLYQLIVNLRAMHDVESAKPALATATVAAANAQLNLK